MAHGHLLLAGFMANRSFQKPTGENSRRIPQKENRQEGKRTQKETGLAKKLLKRESLKLQAEKLQVTDGALNCSM